MKNDEILKTVLSRVNEVDRKKSFELINTSLGTDCLIQLELEDYQECFRNNDEILYLEFDSSEEAELYFSKQRKIKGGILLLSHENELTMSEVVDCVKALTVNTPQDSDYKLFWSHMVSKKELKFFRMLVQFEKTDSIYKRKKSVDFSFVDNIFGTLSDAEAEEMRSCCGLKFSEFS